MRHIKWKRTMKKETWKSLSVCIYCNRKICKKERGLIINRAYFISEYFWEPRYFISELFCYFNSEDFNACHFRTIYLDYIVRITITCNREKITTAGVSFREFNSITILFIIHELVSSFVHCSFNLRRWRLYTRR